MNFSKYVNTTYALATVGYGIARKIPILKNATVEKYNREQREYKRVPMLTVDKIMITGVAGLANVYLWPLFVYKDLKSMEIYMSKSDIDDYTSFKPSCAFDYLFV